MTIHALDDFIDGIEYALRPHTPADEKAQALKELRECVAQAVTEYNDMVTEEEEAKTQCDQWEGEVETLRAENEMLRSALEKFASPRATEAVLQGTDVDIASRCFPFS